MHAKYLIPIALVGPLFALDFYGNQSGKSWKSTRTAHFNVHYDPSQEITANEVARYAEMAHDTLSARYGVSWAVPADLVVQDALFSNGEASSHANRVKLWTTDWGIPLRSYHPWMADVVHHEFGHLASIALGAKGAPWIFGMHFGVSSYINNPVRHDFGFFFPFTAQPAWFAEGTAQYESSRLGFDRWDAHRDMIMRTAVKQDKILSLPQMQTFLGPRALDFELGPYTQGFSLVRYIAQTYGDDKIPALWKATGSFANLSFDNACRRILGRSESKLYEEWKQALRLQYQDMDTAETGKRQNANLNSFADLRSFEGKLWGLTDWGSEMGESSLFWLDPHAVRDSSGALPDSAFQSPKGFPKGKIAWDKGFSIARIQGRLSVFAISYAKRNAKGIAFYDLVRLDSGATKPVFLTQYANVFDPEISADGKTLVVVQKSAHSSCMSLGLAKLDEQGNFDGDLKILDTAAQSETCLDVQSRNPRLAPDASKIAYELSSGKHRVLALMDLPSGRVDTLFAGGHDNRDPQWISPHELLFASDYSGRFEIYKLGLADQSKRRQTRVLGGAFSPLQLGDSLYFVGYDPAGFGLYRAARVDSLIPMDTVAWTETPLPSSETPAFSSKPYSAVPRRLNALPAILVEEKAEGIRGGRRGDAYAKAGGLLELYDPLEKNQLELAFFLELKSSKYVDLSAGGLAPELQRDFSLSWTNNATPITSTTALGYRRMTQNDSLKNEDPRLEPTYREYGLGIWSLAQKLDYSVWKQKDQFSLIASMVNAGFDFYQDNFAFTFLRAYGAGVAFDWSAREKHPQNFLPSPGLEASASWFVQHNDLFRQGSFRESFKVNSSGVISPLFRGFDLQSLDAKLAYHLPMSENSRLSLTSQYSTLPWWSSNDSDTLDAFFYPSVRLHGYPVILPSAENSLLQGRSSSLWTLHAQLPLWTKTRSFGPLMQRGAWIDLFAEHLWLWQDPPAWDELKSAQSLSSVGAELRLSQKVFYSVPLEFYVRASRALNTAHSKEGSWKPEPVSSSLPEFAPSAIEWGLTFRFTEPGEVSLLPTYKGIQIGASEIPALMVKDEE